MPNPTALEAEARRVTTAPARLVEILVAGDPHAAFYAAQHYALPIGPAQQAAVTAAHAGDVVPALQLIAAQRDDATFCHHAIEAALAAGHDHDAAQLSAAIIARNAQIPPALWDAIFATPLDAKTHTKVADHRELPEAHALALLAPTYADGRARKPNAAVVRRLAMRLHQPAVMHKALDLLLQPYNHEQMRRWLSGLSPYISSELYGGTLDTDIVDPVALRSGWIVLDNALVVLLDHTTDLDETYAVLNEIFQIQGAERFCAFADRINDPKALWLIGLICGHRISSYQLASADPPLVTRTAGLALRTRSAALAEIVLKTGACPAVHVAALTALREEELVIEITRAALADLGHAKDSAETLAQVFRPDPADDTRGTLRLPRLTLERYAGSRTYRTRLRNTITHAIIARTAGDIVAHSGQVARTAAADVSTDFQALIER